MTFLEAGFDMEPHLPSLPTEPLDAKAHNTRAIDRLGCSDITGALEDFRQAVGLKPDYAEAWDNSALVK